MRRSLAVGYKKMQPERSWWRRPWYKKTIKQTSGWVDPDRCSRASDGIPGSGTEVQFTQFLCWDVLTGSYGAYRQRYARGHAVWSTCRSYGLCLGGVESRRNRRHVEMADVLSFFVLCACVWFWGGRSASDYWEPLGDLWAPPVM